MAWIEIPLNITSKNRLAGNNVEIKASVPRVDAGFNFRAKLDWQGDQSGANAWTHGGTSYITPPHVNTQINGTETNMLEWIFAASEVPTNVPTQQIVVTFEIEDGKK